MVKLDKVAQVFVFQVLYREAEGRQRQEMLCTFEGQVAWHRKQKQPISG